MSKVEDVKNIADLACLKLSENDGPHYQGHFEKVMDYFKNLDELDTSGVEPMVTPHDIHPPLRVDEVRKDLTVDQALENAPEVKDSLFKVPPVV